MNEINIFDFDKTVVPFDSGSRFWLYCLVRNPWIVVCLPYQLARFVPFLFGIKSLLWAKVNFFCFIRLINLQKNVKGFWDKYEKTVFPYFKSAAAERPAVVISASPDFLLEEIALRLGFAKLICTKHSLKTGKIIGANCKGEEKVRRFNQEVKNAKVVSVYSDSLKHDKPIFSLGENCFHIQKDGTPVSFNLKR